MCRTSPGRPGNGEGGACQVNLLKRGRNHRPGTLRTGTSRDIDHLRDFIRSRQGVEAYLEPRTTVTDTTVVLVASDGEWTRRRVSGPDAAEGLAKKHAIPLYDAVKVGYPQRMRDWTARNKAAGSPSGRPGGGS